MMDRALSTGTVALATDPTCHSRPTRAVSDDGALALMLRPVSGQGVASGGTNAEQLFAAGLAASFQCALARVARSGGIALKGPVGIVASVHLCGGADEALALNAELEVAMPEMSASDAKALMFETQRNCPYARMARASMQISFILR